MSRDIVTLDERLAEIEDAMDALDGTPFGKMNQALDRISEKVHLARRALARKEQK